ncbi:MAG TPA: protein kinase [Dictyobacter sp.]|jgi:serine/threonine protein kinase|nr:protein kinase [Dictyobacter sp.]
MNAESLIGKVLGTCKLEKLVGQGGMGAVFLAQQSRPRRQVAVKVLLPITQLSPNQLAAFLERFRRETDAAASLEHPHIMPVHEYGEQDGIAYLVMPYIKGGTLRDELERQGPLSFSKALDYIEQIAIALDFAHEHGVIHRDIKPANIMVTQEGRLLLTDFGLVKIIAEGQAPQIRLTGAGAPVGTPDYMAPEQVIGGEVDPRSDIYSLGVILFQMLTGTTPFQGETPMQIAAQHLQVPPPSPQILRPDLPIAAEQVILRAMAKRSAERYMSAQDLTDAFRSALVRSGITVEATSTWAGLLSGSTASRIAVPKGQFDPMRQTASLPKISKNMAEQAAPARAPQPNGGGLLARHGARPNTPPQTPNGGGLLSRTGGFQPVNQQSAAPTFAKPAGGGLLSRPQGPSPMGGRAAVPAPPTLPGIDNTRPATGQMTRTMGTGAMAPAPIAPIQPMPAAMNQQMPLAANTAYAPDWSPQPQTQLAPVPTPMAGNMGTGALRNPTGALVPARSNTMTLNDPVKVIKVPVAGQPGQYVTGLLPFTKYAEDEEKPQGKRNKPWMGITLVALIVVLLVGSIGAFIFTHSTNSQGVAGNLFPQQTNGLSSAQVQATATANANIILSDPLSSNIHNWRTTPANQYAFKDNAYDITDIGNQGNAVILPDETLTGTVAYTLTMQEIKGDDTSKDAFGMIFRFNQQQKNGKLVRTFYSFVVTNTKGGQYQLWRYDDSNATSPWTQVKNGQLPLGSEFHQGKGKNTITILMNGSTFTVTVNGKQLSKTFQDTTYTSGGVGMIVNNNGTEVAFSNLLLTHH